MTSSARAEHEELSLNVTDADAKALRESQRPAPMAPADYLRFLSRFAFSYEQLLARKGPAGDEPFRL